MQISNCQPASRHCSLIQSIATTGRVVKQPSSKLVKHSIKLPARHPCGRLRVYISRAIEQQVNHEHVHYGQDVHRPNRTHIYAYIRSLLICIFIYSIQVIRKMSHYLYTFITGLLQVLVKLLKDYSSLQHCARVSGT
jgi:hypothetical protein